MQYDNFDIVKYSGEKVKFSVDKLIKSIKKTGADDATVNQIIDKVGDELYHGISTKEIYKYFATTLDKSYMDHEFHPALQFLALMKGETKLTILL